MAADPMSITDLTIQLGDSMRFSSSPKCLQPVFEKAPITAICVCQPLGQGFPSTTAFTTVSHAGGMAAASLAMPTKLWDSAGRECGRTFLYLQRELFSSCHATFHALVHCPSCYFPKTSFLQPLAAAEGFAARHRSHVTNSFVKTSTHLRTLHLAVEPFLFSGN